MPSVQFRCPDGSVRQLEAPHGATVMEVAVKQGVPGIVAECGGALTCSTCHVYVDPAYLAAVGEIDDIEDEMLQDAVAERRPTSRLSCQIEINDDVDGLVVEIAPEQ
jgi:ferredoxin, 2Fe-2S